VRTALERFAGLKRARKMNGLITGFDSYSRTARLYPSLIAVIPLGGLMLLPATSIVGVLIRGGLVALCASAIAFAFASYVRFRGKSLEGGIIARMGGWPSTTMLRRRDSTIDATTKARYRTELEELSGVALPTELDEAADPVAADAIYRSATKVLLEARRSPEHVILLSENSTYGFWRNLYGVKSLAITLAAAIAVASAILLTLDVRSAGRWTTESTHQACAIAFEALYIVLISLIATERMIHQAARAYAEALLRTLDQPK
jgi:hypothetical protein